MQAVEFEVAYRSDEYRDIVFAVIRDEGKHPGPVWRWLIGAMARMVFAYKTRKVGTCRFRIDERGITRECKLGPMSIAWGEVKSVRRFTGFYIVDLMRGGLPLPMRCLDAAGRATLESLAGARLLARD